MAHVEQTQCHCHRCGKPTLHTRLVQPINHVIHLLIFLFLCGCWLPVWALLAITHNPYSDPWRCAACGQPAGQMTAEQQHALVIRRAQDQAARDHFAALERARQGKARAEKREVRRQQTAAFISSCVVQAKVIAARYDNAVRLLSKGDHTVYVFFHVAIPGLGVIIAGVVMLVIVVIASRLLSA